MARPAPTLRVRVFVLVSAASAVLLTGLVDYLSGPDLSLGVFYLTPVCVGTVVIGRAGGLCLSAESAAVWVLADVFIRKSTTAAGAHVWNGVFRFMTMAVVVVLIDALREALEAARLSERRSQEFLAMAAHQLRTPIAGLRSSAEALVAKGGTRDQERLLSNLAAESGRAGQLVASLLRMARVESGEVGAKSPTNLFDVCSEEVGRFAAKSATVGVDFQAEPEPPAVCVNADAIREALVVLLDNAMRHAATAIQVAVGTRASQLVITVCDDGPGLPPGSEEIVFDRFVSLDGYGGAGLGLAIARGLVEANAGTLRYERRQFEISIPRGSQ